MSKPTIDVRQAVDELLAKAVSRRASDIHLEPTGEGYDLRYRVDGLLETVQQVDQAVGRSYVNRLMVAAKMLTYRLDVPQEGRLTVDLPQEEQSLDLRLAVMPTTHALRAVVRLPAELIQPRTLDQLGLPRRTMRGLTDFAQADSGMLLLCGPAGSGKTTTIYALLQHIVRTSPGLSVIALEDPVERDLKGVTQIEVTPFGELTYDKVLRSLLRQDPQVLALGEIRDAQTASIAVQAALSGHRLITTLHAASPAGAIVRLIEMGLEPYQVASALFGIGAMRLVRRLNDQTDAKDDKPRYAGRAPLCEFAYADQPLRDAINRKGDAHTLQDTLHAQPGAQSLWDVARSLIDAGITDEPEARRVLGKPTDDQDSPVSP